MRIHPLLACVVLLSVTKPGVAQERHHEWVATRYEASFVDGVGEALGSGLDTWHYASLEAGARRARLTSIVRGNWASRFDNDGFQLEADLYPSWPGLGYAYFSGGWSDGGVFPDMRLAGELFASLPAAFEASAGLIYMDFGGDDIEIVVGSVSKYAGNYWLSARPSWTAGDSDFAVTLIARRYLRTPGEFVTVRFLGGTIAEEILTRGNSSLETVGVQADAQLELTPRFLVLPLVAVVREELSSGEARMRYSLGAGGMLRF